MAVHSYYEIRAGAAKIVQTETKIKPLCLDPQDPGILGSSLLPRGFCSVVWEHSMQAKHVYEVDFSVGFGERIELSTKHR